MPSSKTYISAEWSPATKNDRFNEENDEKPIKQLLLPMPQAKNSDKMFKVLESVSHKMPGKTCRRSKLGVDYVFDLYDLLPTMGN